MCCFTSMYFIYVFTLHHHIQILSHIVTTGQNSKKNKMDRLAQELHHHSRLHTSGNKTAMALEYCRSLKDGIVSPLLQRGVDGVCEAVSAMTDYNLLREDLDSLGELTAWSNKKDNFAGVESKVVY